ncbi:MAG: hypothetical protein LBH59_01890 [Planctomycetaceae bacterium]|nr:hypothetical protein [Planctomycetaceae bacterium]
MHIAERGKHNNEERLFKGEAYRLRYNTNDKINSLIELEPLGFLTV